MYDRRNTLEKTNEKHLPANPRRSDDRFHFRVRAIAQSTTDKAKDDVIKAHTAAATAAAKEDFKGSLNMCTPPAPAPAQRGVRGGGGQRDTQPAIDAVPAS